MKNNQSIEISAGIVIGHIETLPPQQGEQRKSYTANNQGQGFKNIF